MIGGIPRYLYAVWFGQHRQYKSCDIKSTLRHLEKYAANIPYAELLQVPNGVKTRNMILDTIPKIKFTEDEND